MTPEQVAASYDRIAEQWLDLSAYGFAAVERAVAFVTHRRAALDVGCGTGRLIGLLSGHGFRTDGLDVSPAMLAYARDRHPEAQLFHADVCGWEPPRPYDLIVAWDSLWHVPLARQEAVLTKLCRGLAAGGVLVFSTGGTDAADERRNSDMGPPMYHATLGVPDTLRVLAAAGCVCRHLEYDQHPESHVYLIAQKSVDAVRLRAVEASRSVSAVALVVRDYDEAVRFFTTALGFEVAEDTPVAAGKRWVVVRPPGGGTALLLAKAATPEQAARVGDQTGGRVFLFLRTDDFWRDYDEMRGRGVRFAEEPRAERYGTVAVFLDLYGNRWDLIGPPAAVQR